jgi:hypothetical protein
MRNRHHRKKGPGRVHAQGFERGTRALLRSWETGQLRDRIESVQRFANGHPKGVLGRVARWRLRELQNALLAVKVER